LLTNPPNENFTPPTKEIETEYGIQYNLQFHGDKGYMQATYAPFFWPTTSEYATHDKEKSTLRQYIENIVQATKALGIAINDQATGNAFGGYFCPHNQDPVNVTRSSAKEAYYGTAARRTNFHLLSGYQVTRILTESSNGTAKVIGVEFASSASAPRQSVKVTQEAILAAGSLHTPQLLQVSGIGDPKLLTSLNVTTVVDLPAVGHNLHDHLAAVVVNIRKFKPHYYG
tara:strand:+ start:4807 stop:5490 length:684 start_codon:yes stop_codon:yes gene_type:complete